MSNYLEGKNNYFFFAGMVYFVGVVVAGILTSIFQFLRMGDLGNYSLYMIEYYTRIFILLTVSIVMNILLYIAFTSLNSRRIAKDSEDLQKISKLYLGIIIIYGLLILAQAVSIIPIGNMGLFMQIVIGVSYILLGIVNFIAYYFIWKLIKKQEQSKMTVVISYAFLIYAIVSLPYGIFYGLYWFGIQDMMNVMLALNYLFTGAHSVMSSIIAFIFILFAFKRSNTHSDIIVPDQPLETVSLQKNCKDCGTSLFDSDQFCTKCGTKVD